MNTLFADTLRKLRTKKGLSQVQLANLMFVNKTTISKWESGSRLPDAAMIARLARVLNPLTRTRTGLVASTVTTGTVLNGIVSDQYLSILLTSNIFGETFRDRGYEERLLSRSVEDSATVTSPLYPWSSCGMTQATILSVPTLTYAPFCFFNLISPLMSICIAAIGWKIVRPKPAAAESKGE